MPSAIGQILRARLRPPPGEIVDLFGAGHSARGYYIGGRYYGTDKHPLGWMPERWKEIKKGA